MNPRLRLVCASIVVLLAVTVSVVAWSHGDYEDVSVCAQASSAAGPEPIRETCGEVAKSSIWWVLGPAAIAVLALGDAIASGRRLTKTSRRE